MQRCVDDDAGRRPNLGDVVVKAEANALNERIDVMNRSPIMMILLLTVVF